MCEGGWRWLIVEGMACWEGLEEKEPAEVLDVARERVDANVEDVMDVVDSR